MGKVLVMTVAEFEDNARRIGGKDAIVKIAGMGPLWPGPDDYSMVIIYLHPGSDGRTWVDSQGNVVLTISAVSAWKLNGAIVFLGTCYGVENTEMSKALFEAGAGAIVAGPGENYGGSGGVLSGADIMAAALRAAVQTGMPAEAAWTIARMYAGAASLRKIAGARDALEFEMTLAGNTPSRWKNFGGCLGGIVALVGLMAALVIGALSPNLTTFTSPVPTLPGSPINTPTPQPTYTPWWAPIGTEVPWPTPTACISGFGCTPYTGSLGIIYYTYFPIIPDGYGWTWETDLYVNGVATDSGASVVYSDSVALVETIDAGGQSITATLVTQWSESLAYSDTSVNIGSVTYDASYITMAITNTTYGIVGQSVFEVLSGTFSTDTITRVLTIYANDAVTPTVVTETETLSHP